MKKEEFFESVKDEVEKLLPEEILREGKIKILKAVKTNDLVLHGLTVERKTGLPSPVYYMDGFLNLYESGRTIPEIAEIFKDGFVEAWQSIPSTEFLYNLEYDYIKEKITFNIVDMDLNRERLASLVYRPMDNGLAYVYYIEMNSEMKSPITKALAKEQSYDLETLHNDAVNNTIRLYPPCLIDMTELINEVEGRLYSEEKNLLKEGNYSRNEYAMYLLICKGGTAGPNALFYPGVIERLDEFFGFDFYILPSSMHEVILLSAKQYFTEDYLKEMVKEINDEFVNTSEILSYKIFKYSYNEKKIISLW